ncbi:hypothetical protein BH09PSE4_BH09PSE4_05780 [soil metagenome]
MKKRARDRLPKREAGSFPTFLYKSLDELEGAWGKSDVSTALIERAHALHKKPLILLSDGELALALSQQIGIQWIRTLALQRLQQDPLKPDHFGDPGGLLRVALRTPIPVWNDLLPEIEKIADGIVPTLRDDPTHSWLIETYDAFKNAI